ncbi:MAG TPA: hypothetical protein VFL83_12805 [Anaeromyxobacter sp.]|nr:hypothetical protein [Anaeromyxobacter sp.]
MHRAASRTLAVAAAALALSSGPAAAPAPRPIEDDYHGALAEAKRLGVPLLVDVWAPW